jgi:hypothetical protein
MRQFQQSHHVLYHQENRPPTPNNYFKLQLSTPVPPQRQPSPPQLPPPRRSPSTLRHPSLTPCQPRMTANCFYLKPKRLHMRGETRVKQTKGFLIEKYMKVTTTSQMKKQMSQKKRECLTLSKLQYVN